MRDTCIARRAKERYLILREDYIGMISACKPKKDAKEDKDYCAGALLSLIEYWANGKLTDNPNLGDRIPLGARKASDWTNGVMGLYSSKRVMERVRILIELDFLDIEESPGSAPKYWANIDVIQAALDRYITKTYPRQMSTPPKSPQTNVLPTPDKCLDPPDKCLGVPQTNVDLSIYKKDLKESSQESLSKNADAREGERESRPIAPVVEVLDPEVVPESTAIAVEILDPEDLPNSVQLPKSQRANNSFCLENSIDRKDKCFEAARDNKRHRMRYNREQIKDLWEKFNIGEITHIDDNYLKNVADYVMGDLVEVYRHSGVIQWSDTQDHRDITEAFLNFVTLRNGNVRNAGHARQLIGIYERSPKDWGTLIRWTEEWKDFNEYPEKYVEEAMRLSNSKHGKASPIAEQVAAKATEAKLLRVREKRLAAEAIREAQKEAERGNVPVTPSKPATDSASPQSGSNQPERSPMPDHLKKKVEEVAAKMAKQGAEAKGS